LPLLTTHPTQAQDMSSDQRKRFNLKLNKLGRLGSTTDADGNFRYKHPYETEILHMTYPDATLQFAEPIPYLPVDTTTATWVDTYEGVLEMLEELRGAKEIAVDLEHHDFRSYTGLVSLMQISIRTKDWVVDTLKPWRHRLEILNEVFTNPNIIKVHLARTGDTTTRY